MTGGRCAPRNDRGALRFLESQAYGALFGRTAPGNGGTGYGLRALGQRLEAVYGDSGGLTIIADTPAGYEVSVRLPCEAPRADFAVDGDGRGPG
jgi:LytS/YehU family sensor histidine kinase